MKINQYEIVLVNLEPTLGSEISKTRPCVVISPDEMNHYLNTIVIIPLTSTLKKYPTRISISNHNVKGMAAVDQIRTIDKLRIVKIIGSLEIETIEKIKKTIDETYVK
ncbi:MAG: type II toxin-antitoxin system PemK/MazF family toxin [Saprospiraceae bacterium]|nr:type II toxin-antitoxin system PemK/MazF family toxin [Saprospiraceae bacterium]MBK8669307.1 type II toxin-antitoxin system PemK/MazF family toxin [Saprospiraceae bacterium]